MKTYKIFYLVIASIFLACCNDDFMDRFPETSITEKVFFSSPADLETYTNGMYGYIGSSYWDVVSDNVLYVETSEIYRMMGGSINEKTVGSWSGYWSRIRNINFMLARTHQVSGDPAEINHYVGIAKLFKAYLYYNLVKRYSNVPWYSKDIQTTETDLLYKTQDPRTLVVDSIMNNLQFAVDYINSGTSKTRITKNAALALQARIALHEGTFRKYHTELNLSDGDKFLKIAAEAAKEIIDSQEFSLNSNYQSLFNSLSLQGNSEIILFEDFDEALRKQNVQCAFDWTTGLSKDLMEDYLAIVNGKAVPFHQIPNYAEKSVTEFFENRDPRLGQTFMKPGHVEPGKQDAYRPVLTLGGYPQIKFRPTTDDQLSWGESYTDLPIIRYAEVLLIYAEARAELGQLTDEDIMLTINNIRSRAGLPPASLSEWLANIDHVQSNRYKNVSSLQAGAVLEIRRERRVELACEGFRFDDLMRWSAGKLLESAPEGVYIKQLGYQDITGDGVPDIAIVRTKADSDNIPAEDKERYRLTIYLLEGSTIELTEGDKGYIRMVAQYNKFKFEEPKYYYYPLDQQDMLVNPNLIQNVYWR